MAKVCEFYGIRVYFYFDDHPPPHFHVFYGEYEAKVAIETLKIMAGFLPSRAYSLVAEWASVHRSDLRRAWQSGVSSGADRSDRSVGLRRRTMERIVDAKARANYRLWLRFTDGAEGEVDLSFLVGQGVFARWNDPAEFARVRVDPTIRTVSWPGDIDLDPDVLYARLTGKPLPDARP